jgi:NADPH2:quinone reductase
VNPVETYIRTGTYASKPNLPYTPGTDCAGVVKALGENVKAFKVGDRVYTQGSITGTYASQTVCDVASVHPLPKQATFQQGAAVGVPYATAYYGLFIRGKLEAGETLLIHGASGGVGIAAVQLATTVGITVFGTAGSARGRQLVNENGAHRVFDHHAANYLQEIMEATGGRGVDAILEMAANTNLAKDPTVLSKRGRVIVIGNRGPIEINARDFMQRNADIRAMSLPNAEPREVARMHAAIVAGLQNQTLRPVVGRELSLSDAAQAHRDVMEAGAYGKIVLVS